MQNEKPDHAEIDAQRYRDYAEMSSDWYWEQDAEFRFTYFSREFEEVTGVPSSAGLGKTRWGGLGRDRFGNVDWPAHQKMLEAHQPFRNFEYPGVRPDGRLVWFSVSGKPRFDQQGVFVGYFGIASNVTERHAMETHIHQSERLAAIGQLAAGMAHEINNPVGFIRSNIETLGKYLDGLLAVAEACAAQPVLPEAITQAMHAADIEFVREDAPLLLEECRGGLERVSKIVANLREFAQEGQDDWRMSDLQACLDSTINLLSGSLSPDLAIVREDASLPQVRCRPAQINQLLLVLLTNAIQALDGKAGKITVRTGADDSAHVWFEIADTGCGISPESLPRIFEPFFTTRPVGQGTGMGLATAFGIVNDHAGRIEVDSSLGVGSCFRVTLPVTES